MLQEGADGNCLAASYGDNSMVGLCAKACCSAEEGHNPSAVACTLASIAACVAGVGNIVDNA